MQEKIYARQASQIQKSLGIDKIDIVWSFDPFRFFNQRVWKARNFIYHTVDVHLNKCFEEDIAATSDLVLLVSESLRPKLSNTNKNIHFIGHGADLESFEASINKSVSFNKQGIIVGLIGNFNNNVDYNIIEKLPN